MTFVLEKLAFLKNGQPGAVKPSRCCGERHGAEAEYIHLTTEA